MHDGDEMKPVAWKSTLQTDWYISNEKMLEGKYDSNYWMPLYTAPRELSDDDLWFILHCLDESVDDVHNSYLEQARLYGNMPTRKARIDGYKMSYENHLQAIKMIEDILKKASEK
jgi:hypothetical protein